MSVSATETTPAGDAVASADATRWPWPLFAFVFTLTILKGVRMPNRWSVTQYLFTYQQGFIKRGLWGELLHFVLRQGTSHYFTMAAVAFVVLGLFLWLVARECRRQWHAGGATPLLLVFMASPALTFSAHMVGYLEQIAYVAWAAIAFSRVSFRTRWMMSLVAAALLPLLHDASIFWVGALSCLALVVAPRSPADRAAFASPASTRRKAVASLAAVWLLSTAAVGALGRVSVDQAARIRDQQTEYFDIRPRQDAFATLTVSTGAALADMKQRWSEPDVQQDMVLSLLVFAPAFVFLGAIALRCARVSDEDAGIRRLAQALAIAAMVSPLLLHIVAWDRHRWNGLATLNAGLAALLLFAARRSALERTADEPSTGPSRRASAPLVASVALAIGVCVWGAIADPVFFDNYTPAHPPFGDQIRFLIEAARTGDKEMWIPKAGN